MGYVNINDVSCTSKTGYKILKVINLNVEKGECILLMGLSGSGKTSLTKLINGIIPHFEEETDFVGEVLIEGESTRNISQYKISEKVGSIFQNPKSQFFNSDVEGEIVFGLENMGTDPELIKKSLKKTINNLNIDRLLGKNVFSLSSGEKQILAFASIFALNTDIVVLDEPSSNLDMDTIETIKNNIEIFKKEGKTIIVAEHRLYYLKDIIDKAYYIDEGIIKDCFTQEEIKLFNSKKENNLEIRTLSTPKLEVLEKEFNKNDEYLCEDLSYTINGNFIFKDINISLNRGEVLGIVGKNGIGKTSLLKCITGLMKKNTGSVFFDNKLLNNKDRLKNTYLVTQDINSQLFTRSVKEECELNLPEDRLNQVDVVLNRLGLDKYKDKHPMSLSGGQKQRLTIALALLSNKEIIIFDEPTSGLDFKNMIIVSEAIKDLAKKSNKVVIVVSHDYEFLNTVADGIYEMA